MRRMMHVAVCTGVQVPWEARGISETTGAGVTGSGERMHPVLGTKLATLQSILIGYFSDGATSQFKPG